MTGTFASQDNGKSSDATTRFLNDLTIQNLGVIQHTRFESDSVLRPWLGSQEDMVSVYQSKRFHISNVLAYKCPRLQRHLLIVEFDDDDQAFSHASPGSGSNRAASLKDNKPPAWAYLFGKIQGLHHLDVRILYEA